MPGPSTYDPRLGGIPHAHSRLTSWCHSRASCGCICPQGPVLCVAAAAPTPPHPTLYCGTQGAHTHTHTGSHPHDSSRVQAPGQEAAARCQVPRPAKPGKSPCWLSAWNPTASHVKRQRGCATTHVLYTYSAAAGGVSCLCVAATQHSGPLTTRCNVDIPKTAALTAQADTCPPNPFLC
jgi:hypothetical protein